MLLIQKRPLLLYTRHRIAEIRKRQGIETMYYYILGVLYLFAHERNRRMCIKETYGKINISLYFSLYTTIHSLFAVINMLCLS